MSPPHSPPASLHERILGDIEQQILSGAWPPGHRIATEIELSEQYGCSRMTVNKVLTQLASRGMIDRRRKAGSFVGRPRSRSAALEIKDIRAEVEALSLPYRFELVGRRQRASSRADRELLGLLQAGTSVLELGCLHHAGERPFCLEQRLINLSAVPQAAAASFEDIAPGAWLLDRAPWSSAEHRIRAGAADAQMAALLAVPAGSACLTIERRTWLGSEPVTLVRLSYPGDVHELVARFQPVPDRP